MLFLTFLFAHVCADFLLQPRRLVLWKERSFLGVMAHAAIHIFVSLLFVFPFISIPQVWYAVLSVGVLHALIDQFKISFQRETGRYVKPFLVDQAIHLLVIFSVIKGFGIFSISAGNPLWVLAALVIICGTAVYDMAFFQWRREREKSAQFHFSKHHFGLRIFLIALTLLVIFWASKIFF